MDGRIAGLFTVADTVRPASIKAMKDLRKLGISKTLLITGDSMIVGENIGSELGVAETHSEVHPERKLAIIRELQSEGQ